MSGCRSGVWPRNPHRDVGGSRDDGRMSDVLERFSPATQDWFRSAFAAPTNAQSGAWQTISAGKHALVVAPTGSGKTLSAFLWALDRIFRDKANEPAPTTDKKKKRADAGAPRTRVLYVSPLKALGVDVERNLRSPLVGIGQSARRLGPGDQFGQGFAQVVEHRHHGQHRGHIDQDRAQLALAARHLLFLQGVGQLQINQK